MKIAFAGKGGSGKTTLSSLFVRHLAGQGLPVVAIDADINQHLAEALGVSGAAAGDGRASGRDQGVPARRQPADRLGRGDGQDHAAGPGLPAAAARRGRPGSRPGVGTPCGARLMATGPFSDDDLGVACYHSKTGAVELYLNHLVDGPGEYVVVDCTAGADSFASGLFTRFDLTFLVAEPTRKGVGVYRQWSEYAAATTSPSRWSATRSSTSQDAASCASMSAMACLPASATNPRSAPWNRAARSTWPTSAGRRARPCSMLQDAVDAQVKDWAKFTRQAAEFHLKNARAWANAAVGADLAAQVDPGFALSPAAPESARA